jgi:hypothetical protein
MWWLITRKSGGNAKNLQDLVGLGSYNTTWLPEAYFDDNQKTRG